ncbi:S8 family serine peptidase [Neolewinella antarctica]|uniref:Subtilisin family serine protease n=1 Tax=Neolewinella antarctica TaxID=442734 RepID=A0ABX0XBD7_9BACT|nr:S8 family serine peptidase [Neolewinella antarctica]NJC26589.1 subtilisin family serine protease [Neolewinella antarctica]
MKRIILFGALALTAFSCQDDLQISQPTTEQTPLTRTAIDLAVETHLQQTDTPFDWAAADDNFVWSALAASENHAVLGYQPAGFQNLDDRIHEIDVMAGEWKTVRDELVTDLRTATERLTGETVSEDDLLLVADDGALPILEIKVLHPGILAEFRNRADVRYLEPSNYTAGEITLRSGSGCSEAPSSSVDPADFTTITPGAKVPWNYATMNVEQAWNSSQGAGIGIAVIDSGVYPEQDNLSDEFDGGFSTNRSIDKLGFYAPSFWSSRTDGPDDQCGHGTQMSGLAAAPRTNTGATVGVAYKANLRTYRATSDVIINASREKRGVKNSLIDAGRQSGTQVISMSIGDVFSSGTVEDGINYAHNRGKMILCAAGTSLTWTSWYGVIFPANLDNTVAVTGVREGLPFKRCDNCHDGSQVDFVTVMQRRDDTDRLTLTLSRYDATPGYVGGSSAATATTAGVAALVWATNPGQTREQVLDRMKAASSVYPGRDGDFGWGIIDANLAVN